MKVLVSTYSNGSTVDRIFREQNFEKLILLTSSDFSKQAKEYKKCKKSEVIIIDPFDHMTTTLKIIRKLKSMNNEYFINITEGTNIMAAACLTCAYYLGIGAMYVAKDQIISIPIPGTGYSKQISSSAKQTLSKIDKELQAMDSITQSQLAGTTQSQKYTVPLAILEKACLIERFVQGRDKYIKMTVAGKIFLEMER
ncbi:hypothetical protein H6504_00450 [Candidatus Woesearchaeota archaeon]|nr:hypothetical protein [Candidatus Woesearchaeota archaeon]